MKRLFQVDWQGGKDFAKTPESKFTERQFFGDKAAAKHRRDALNASPEDKTGWYVTYGPDHHLFNKGFIPGRFKGKHGGKVTSGIAKNKRLTHPDRADRMRQRNLRPAAAA